MTAPLILKDVVKTFELPTIPRDASAASAMRKMLDEGKYTLLVPRRTRTDSYGVLTKKDIVVKVIAEGRDPAKVLVKDIMSRPLVILTNLSLELRWVAKAMSNSGVSTIAVFDKGDFYGYVTEACILEGVYNALRRAKLEQGVEYVSC
jgi:signal-transduction protein with cAMP-binding, CBS, and nucleotidyltransferase domain